MAILQFLLSKRGGDRPEIILNLRAGAGGAVRLRCGTTLHVERKHWNEKGQRINTMNAGAMRETYASTNVKLDKIKTEVLNAYESDSVVGVTIDRSWLTIAIARVVNPDQVGALLCATSQAPTLIAALRAHVAALPGKTQDNARPITESRLRIYRQTENHLVGYCNECRQGRDLTLQEVDEQFYHKFVNYLYRQGLKANTVGSRIRDIKAVINGLDDKWKSLCPWVKLVPEKKCVVLKERIDNIYLNEKELQRLADLDLHDHPTLERCRDHFLLLAWTGCRYSDLEKLLLAWTKYVDPSAEVETPAAVKVSDSGLTFKITQQKTKNSVVIPILPPAMAVLEKYDGHLPAPITNQKFNKDVKRLCKLAGLDEEVTIKHTCMDGDGAGSAVALVEEVMPKFEAVGAHTARRSFATNMFKRNFPAQVIMKITGHKTTEAFMRYILIDENENADDVLKNFKWNE